MKYLRKKQMAIIAFEAQCEQHVIKILGNYFFPSLQWIAYSFPNTDQNITLGIEKKSTLY